MSTASKEKFEKFNFALIFYTLLVILWGAWVRISHSGDGCGNHWPLCQGSILPNEAEYKTWIEFSHRMMSGLFGIIIIIQFFWARRLYKRGSVQRKTAGLALGFMISEALLGAVLVKASLVGQEDSPMRALVMGLHLMNSLMLIAFITLLWDFSRHSEWQKNLTNPFDIPEKIFKKIKWSMVMGFFLIAATGVIAALATTLFPSQSLLLGLIEDFSAEAHYLLRWRGLHPLLALLIGGSMAWSLWLLSSLVKSTPSDANRTSEVAERLRKLYRTIFFGIIVGILTLSLLSPLVLKLLHLCITYLIWIRLVLLARTLSWKWQS